MTDQMNNGDDKEYKVVFGGNDSFKRLMRPKYLQAVEKCANKGLYVACTQQK